MSQDYQNLDHLKRLQRSLRAGKHALLKSIFPDIVRMNTWRLHSDGEWYCSMGQHESYEDFLRRCWSIHHLVGDLWASRLTNVEDEWRL